MLQIYKKYPYHIQKYPYHIQRPDFLRFCSISGIKILRNTYKMALGRVFMMNIENCSAFYKYLIIKHLQNKVHFSGPHREVKNADRFVNT